MKKRKQRFGWSPDDVEMLPPALESDELPPLEDVRLEPRRPSPIPQFNKPNTGR